MTIPHGTFNLRRTGANTVCLDLANLGKIPVQELHKSLTEDFNNVVGSGDIKQTDLVCINGGQGTKWSAALNVTVMGALATAACKTGNGLATFNNELKGYHVQKGVGQFKTNSIVDDIGNTINASSDQAMRAGTGG